MRFSSAVISEINNLWYNRECGIVLESKLNE